MHLGGVLPPITGMAVLFELPEPSINARKRKRYAAAHTKPGKAGVIRRLPPIKVKLFGIIVPSVKAAATTGHEKKIRAAGNSARIRVGTTEAAGKSSPRKVTPTRETRKALARRP